MKIIYIGSGYVGACSAAVSADSGHEILIYDIDEEKIKKFASFNKEKIESCLFEEGLADLIVRNKERLNFTHKLDEVGRWADEAKAVFMCLPTPEKGSSGETDMSYYEAAVNDLGKIIVKRNEGKQTNYLLIINKSTVPINTSEKTINLLGNLGVKDFGVGSNPEFLVEGKAVEGSIRPERVVVGAGGEKDKLIFRDIYKRFFESPSTNYIEVNPIEAEAGKLLANFTLFKRLAVCYDVIGRVCETFDNMHYENVRKILITDKRIGSWGFYDSLFAGGSCFIKDSRSLSYQLKQKGAETAMIDNVLEANSRQLSIFLSRPEKDLKFDWIGKKAGLLGLAFKRDTDDIRNSAALKAATFLLSRGVDLIRAYDPVAGNNFMKYFSSSKDASKIELADSEEDIISTVDVLMIITDWPQFRELAGLIKEKFKPGGLVMDGRRMLQHEYDNLRNSGYTIVAVGSPTMAHNK